jgi:hypothetical protein
VIDPSNPSLDELVASLKAKGQLEPVVVTLDNVLLSGHRRRAAALRLRWRTLKVRVHPIHSLDPDFEKVLISYNTQRDKSPDVRIREQLMLTDPEKAYRAIVSEREAATQIKAEVLTLGAGKKRAKITAAKQPFLDAVIRIINELKQYWPLSDRRVHYSLLNDPPLRHAGKPESYVNKKGRTLYNRYRNDKPSYKDCCNLLTRARLTGQIPFNAIGDETRPVTTWDVHVNVSPFFRREVEQFCTGYARDLLSTQPNHIEIVGEKLTVEGIIRPVASKYCIPYTIGRGYSSLPPRKEMYDRYRKSGKAKLVILFLGDHDPEGWNIAETFAKSMRDDFGIAEVVAVKVALKPEQAAELRLPPNTDAKESSSRFKAFAEQFGSAAYELEAAPPDMLQGWLVEAVRSVLCIDRFNEQVELEKKDATKIQAYRQASKEHLKALRLE